MGRRAVAALCRKMYDHGWMEGTGGNVSVRSHPGDRVLITASGFSKGELTSDQVTEVGLPDGQPVAGTSLSPSRETSLHLALYVLFSDCAAVVHAHAPYATIFATLACRAGCDSVTFADYVIIEGLGPNIQKRVTVPVFANHFPVGDVALDMKSRLRQDSPPVLLLADHGVIGWGPTLEIARNRLECLEAICRSELIIAGLARPLAFDAKG